MDAIIVIITVVFIVIVVGVNVPLVWGFFFFLLHCYASRWGQVTVRIESFTEPIRSTTLIHSTTKQTYSVCLLWDAEQVILH